MIHREEVVVLRFVLREATVGKLGLAWERSGGPPGFLVDGETKCCGRPRWTPSDFLGVYARALEITVATL